MMLLVNQCFFAIEKKKLLKLNIGMAWYLITSQINRIKLKLLYRYIMEHNLFYLLN